MKKKTVFRTVEGVSASVEKLKESTLAVRHFLIIRLKNWRRNSAICVFCVWLQKNWFCFSDFQLIFHWHPLDFPKEKWKFFAGPHKTVWCRSLSGTLCYLLYFLLNVLYQIDLIWSIFVVIIRFWCVCIRIYWNVVRIKHCEMPGQNKQKKLVWKHLTCHLLC